MQQSLCQEITIPQTNLRGQRKLLVQSYNLVVVLMCRFIGRLIFTGKEILLQTTYKINVSSTCAYIYSTVKCLLISIDDCQKSYLLKVIIPEASCIV